MKKADPQAKAIAYFCLYVNTDEPNIIKTKYSDSYLVDKKGKIELYANRPFMHCMRLTTTNSYAKALDKVFDFFIPVPTASEAHPILMIVPIQMLAYNLAVLRGCDPDKPRNLAKSVTVK